jgi:DNA-binding response OmpR family regulator
MKSAWIVDDDTEMAQAVKLMLKLLDFQIRSFLQARDAAKILQYGDKPDLMILDINMPEISGFDMLEYVRRNPDWQDIPIVMLSTESSEVLIEQAIEMGADAYVSKPVTIDELEAAIEIALQKHHPS